MNYPKQTVAATLSQAGSLVLNRYADRGGMVFVDSTTMAMTASDPGVGLTVEWRAQSVASNQDHQYRRRLGVAHRHAGSRVTIACALRTVLRFRD
jgi:hypothetical protein